MSRQPDDVAREGFVTRWSRRKAGDVSPERENEVAPSIDATGENRSPSNEESPPAASPAGRMITDPPRRGDSAEHSGEARAPRPALTDADMPPLESLDENSDYSGFLSPGVSGKLRKLALRKLFSSPGFNIRDGLDDYDDDYTNYPPLGDTVTADMKYRAKVAERRRQEAEDAKREKRLAAEQQDQGYAGEEPVDTVVSEEDDATVGEAGKITQSGTGGANESREADNAAKAPPEESITLDESAASENRERRS